MAEETRCQKLSEMLEFEVCFCLANSTSKLHCVVTDQAISIYSSPYDT